MDCIERPNAETSWIRLLSSALSTANSLERTAQLATTRGPASADLCGRPACRSIHIRSFDNGKLYFFTDLRSGKVDDVTHSPYVELCWFAQRHSLQFRISGHHRILRSCDQSDTAWGTLTQSERLLWAGPLPGKQWSGADAFNVSPSEQAPDCFCVFEIIPSHVEVLDLSKMPVHREVHTRVIKKATGDNDQRDVWTVQRVNP